MPITVNAFSLFGHTLRHVKIKLNLPVRSSCEHILFSSRMGHIEGISRSRLETCHHQGVGESLNSVISHRRRRLCIHRLDKLLDSIMNGEQDRVMSPCDTALRSLIDRYFATTQDVFESSSIATTKGAFSIPSICLSPAFEHTWGGAGVLNAVESEMQV